MNIKKESPKICKEGIWDLSIPDIKFDKEGISNYAYLHHEMEKIYPRGDIGLKNWTNLVFTMKKKGKSRNYDCIVGVSGGTDSSYLLHLARENDLRVLAVNIDNGWSSKIAVNNIKRVTAALNIDLETFVIDYIEVQAVLRAYIKAGLPWIDSPTDLAIKAALYKIARREKIKYILNGADFRSEGKQPTLWTYGDAKQLKYIVKKFEKIKLKSFPYYTLFGIFKYGFLFGIKMYRPFYYLDYQKKDAQELLKEQYGWEYYGGHHHENLFTKFAIGYWLPQKFKIDKRIITSSAQVLSKEITRSEALALLKEQPYDDQQLKLDTELVLKKLKISKDEFDIYWQNKNHYYFDYPSYMPTLKKFQKIIHFLYKYFLPFKPTFLIEQEIINGKFSS